MKITAIFSISTFLLLGSLLVARGQQWTATPPFKEETDLSGDWRFRTDPQDKGEQEQWYKQTLPETVKLPGSMTTNQKGDDITVNTPWTGSIFDSSWFHDPAYSQYRIAGKVKVPFWLQPDKYYKGAAWYQRTIDIPANWDGRELELFLERCHWETKVWIDDTYAGMQNSLATPHVYTLTGKLAPGQHTLSIRVDNRVKDIDVGPNSHSISDHTQGNWNGLAGRLLLKAKNDVYISDVQLYPDIAAKNVTALITVRNNSGKPVAANVSLQAMAQTQGAETLQQVAASQQVDTSAVIKVVYPMGQHPLLWDEFHPNVYQMTVAVSAGKPPYDIRQVLFGMREFATKGTHFTINGRPTFLRGTLECAAFPKTGYPPTDTASWMRIFRICRSYGLNHLRFHSWCPPEAAFEAADRSGFYLHIECSSWANQGAVIGDGKPLDAYIYEESRKIVKAYGNHPSFCMLLYGNEPAGKHHVQYLTDFVKYWKQRDSRRLYSTGAGWPIISESDFNSTPAPRIQQWGEGLKSIINSQPPRTDYDWSAIISKWQHPTVSHEIGQWCVYPDFDEIKQYDGVLKAKNFEIFRDQLQKNGMGKLAHDFLLASGKLQVLCYKADIEAALRTPGFGGFQLLGLYDFPGQGTALVGVLNPFWRDKGYVTGPEYSSFCNAVVPLVRLPKMVYLSNEHLSADVEIAQFGPAVLTGATPSWQISNSEGQVLFKDDLPKKDIPFGNAINLGQINTSLSSITKPSRLTLTVEVAGYKNAWDIFVYPAYLPAADPHILVTQELDQQAQDVLNSGGKVLLSLKKGALKADKGGDIAIGFSSIFWNTAWTKQQPPVTLGILCDSTHPALREFPTQSFSNWQWQDAMSHAGAIKLDAVKKGLQPIVRVIDDWVTARSLGLLFECKVGKGSLLVSGIDLVTDRARRPEARQLLFSLQQYMHSKDFKPDAKVDLAQITALYQ
ncbi:beta-galactosidase [Chitinophaga agrisoli]|uniref:beta-galactosidase n=1 Tax=Chitinophaga agrisoli TaxID=2607653 RepID=A0A5B2VXI3_9BACT|nr:sugar-binding domain-containing protein [Chitinophaga agrisoli]KAA2243318.1 beta-galactosidase [Chitinophaga agrisoli]